MFESQTIVIAGLSASKKGEALLNFPGTIRKIVEGARSRTVDDKYWQIRAKDGEKSLTNSLIALQLQ